MATKSYEELLAGAEKIMENELPESNTHVLVGTHLKEVVERMQDDDTQRGKKFTELEKKLKGDKASVNNGFDYPFVYLGSFADYAGLAVELDKLHSKDNSSQTVGKFRALMNGNLLFITNYVRSWADDEFLQRIEGTVKIADDGSLAVTTDVGRFIRRYFEGKWSAWEIDDRYDEFADIDETYNLNLLSTGASTVDVYTINKHSFYIKIEADADAFTQGSIPARIYRNNSQSVIYIPLNEYYKISNDSEIITKIALYYLSYTISRETSIHVVIYKTNDLAKTLSDIDLALTNLNKNNSENKQSIDDLSKRVDGIVEGGVGGGLDIISEEEINGLF